MSKIAFCYSGDGARGSIQSGITLGLYRQGIKPDFTIGISSGSACAASYAFNGPEGCAEMWSNMNSLFSLFRPNWNILWGRGVMNQKPSEKIVAKMVNETPICEAVVVHMNIFTGEVEYVSSKNVSAEVFAEATLSAVAATGFVQDRNGWVDAGSRQMLPLQQCIDAGCDEIYVILGRPMNYVSEWTLPKGLLKAAWMGYRALDLSLYELLVRDIKSCLRKNDDPDFRNIKIHIVEPKELLFDCLEFKHCKRGVEYGLTEWEITEEQALRASLL